MADAGRIGLRLLEFVRARKHGAVCGKRNGKALNESSLYSSIDLSSE